MSDEKRVKCTMCQTDIEVLECDILYRHYPSLEDNSKYAITCDNCAEYLYGLKRGSDDKDFDEMDECPGCGMEYGDCQCTCPTCGVAVCECECSDNDTDESEEQS